MSTAVNMEELDYLKMSHDSSDESHDSDQIENDKENADDTDMEARGTKTRDSWTRGIDFLVACVGGSVGLGNVWRFPYLCYKNGGGAFLIPYFTCMVVGALPLFIMETSMGQYMTAAGPKAWNMVPLFQGIGFSSTIIIYYFTVYYNVIIGWSLFYFFHSFASELPWNSCDNDWNTQYCTTNFTRTRITGRSSSPLNNTIYNISGDTRDLFNSSRDNNMFNISSNSQNATTGANGSLSSFVDVNLNESAHRWIADPVTEFWERKVLAISGGIEDMGYPKWDLVLCLLLAWVLVYLCICKGIKSSGKVMYITAPAPYAFMLIILIRNATLEGAADGVRFYIQPNITKLLEIGVWTDAGKQIFFSSSVCQNVIITLGSYNKFKHNSCRDSVYFAFINAFTSIFAGFLVFTILGFMAFQQGRPISEVAESGPGLAFIAYPKAVVQMPLSQFWSASFFLMLLLLGLDSQFLSMETFTTAVIDQFPHILRRGHRKEIFIAGVCVFTFFTGLIFCFNGGMYVFQIFDSYAAGKNLILMGLLQSVAIAYFYGFRRFFDNMEMMVGTRWISALRPYLSFCWLVATPALCLLTTVMGIISHQPLTYNRPMNVVYDFPNWADGIGWTFAIFSVIWIPVIAFTKFYKYGFTKEVFKLLIVPYYLKPHQRRPQDQDERSLKTLELERQPEELERTMS